jgi:hypothetical protein
MAKEIGRITLVDLPINSNSVRPEHNNRCPNLPFFEGGNNMKHLNAITISRFAQFRARFRGQPVGEE